MILEKLLKAAVAYKAVQWGLDLANRRPAARRRRNLTRGGVSVLALAAGAGAVWYFRDELAEFFQREEAPAWPSRKKLEKDARRAEAQARAHEAPAKPAAVHVEKNAPTDLKVKLGDIVPRH